MHVWDKVTKVTTVTLPVLYGHSIVKYEMCVSLSRALLQCGGGGVVVTELFVN